MRLEEQLYELRKRKGITQAQVAEAIGVSRQAVSKWESGTASPSLDNLKSLSSLYGVPVDNLINEGELVASETSAVESPVDINESQNNPASPLIPSFNYRHSDKKFNRKHLVIFSIGILIVLFTVVLIFIMLSFKFNSERNRTTLDDLHGGEISVSSSDSFDFEF